MNKPSTVSEKLDDGLNAENDDMLLWRRRFDEQIVENVIDPDSWKHEENLLARPERDSRRSCDCSNEDSIESEGIDFRDQLDEGECCSGGCIKCCTSADLMALPPALVKGVTNPRIQVFEGRRQQVFDLLVR